LCTGIEALYRSSYAQRRSRSLGFARDDGSVRKIRVSFANLEHPTS